MCPEKWFVPSWMTFLVFIAPLPIPTPQYLLNIAINALHFSPPGNAKNCEGRAALTTAAAGTASHSEPAEVKLWQGPHLINSGIIITFNNRFVYLENLSQSFNKLVWKPPGGLTSEILPQITIMSAQMSRVIDIYISRIQSLLQITFPIIWLVLGSVSSKKAPKKWQREGRGRLSRCSPAQAAVPNTYRRISFSGASSDCSNDTGWHPGSFQGKIFHPGSNG